MRWQRGAGAIGEDICMGERVCRCLCGMVHGDEASESPERIPADSPVEEAVAAVVPVDQLKNQTLYL